MGKVKLVPEGSTIILKTSVDSLVLNGVARELTDDLGFEIHAPGSVHPELVATPIKVEVIAVGEMSRCFTLTYERVNQVAPRIIADIKERLA